MVINEDFRERMLRRQYDIPHRLNYLAEKYPGVTWKDAQQIYRKIVSDILEEHKVECITDMGLSYGRGFLLAERMFEDALKDYQLRAINGGT